MQTEAQIKGVLDQKKSVLLLKSSIVGKTWEETKLITDYQIKLLEWVLSV